MVRMFEFWLVKTYYFEFSFSKKDEDLKWEIFNYVNDDKNSHLKDASLLFHDINGKKIGKIYYVLGTKSQTETRKIRGDLIKKFGISPGEIFYKKNLFFKTKTL